MAYRHQRVSYKREKIAGTKGCQASRLRQFSLSVHSDTWVEMTSRLINLFECALCVALLYGINLYFSITGNISNPVVPMWWPATKDAFFLLLFCLFLIGLRVHHPRWSLPLTLVIVFSATCAALSISSFGFSKESLSFTKNILLYFAGGAIIGTLIAGVCSPPEMALRVSRVVFISVLVGFACLLLPAQSTDGRLYGTYGNPTSFGYAVFLAFALSVAFRPASESIMFALLLGLVYVVTGSISVLLAAGDLHHCLLDARNIKEASRRAADRAPNCYRSFGRNIWKIIARS